MKFNSVVFLAGFTLLVCLSPLVGRPADDEVRLYIDRLNNGQVDEVKKALPDLVAKYQNNPGVIYLQGRLASNGIEAVKLYQALVTNFPKSEWADDALYRICQYYYAMGLYRTAEAKLAQLKRDYPNSPFASKTFDQKSSPLGKNEAQAASEGPDGGGAPQDSSAVIQPRSPSVKAEPEISVPPKTLSKAQTMKTSPTERQGKYALQVGAFTTAANADKQKSFFENLGYTVEMTNKVRDGKSYYVVWVGSFNTPDGARGIARQIRSKYKIDSIVVER